LELPDIDKAGVRRTDAIRNKLRSRMSAANAEVAPKVSAQDLKEIENH
jgi:ubiquinol-cytochrome c reductase cytochrome b subunit